MDSQSTTEKKEDNLLISAFLRNNYPFYIVSFAIFTVIKILFNYCSNWGIFLNPIDTLVGIATNSQSVFIAPNSYYHDKLNIIIDKSCSGVNFMIICFISLCFITPKYLSKRKHRFIAIPLLLILSYVLTVLINSLRIIFFVTTNKLHEFLHLSEIPAIHLIEGAFIYLTSLVLIYMTYNFLLNKYTGGNNAKCS